ncbi:hypothetical protein H9L39_11482 [Fusarium oxysporum f. sp. albedinis]|nr:hypothetical protein H9L39_11482 [Fusarium oxysporum f. sp. albedinis]
MSSTLPPRTPTDSEYHWDKVRSFQRNGQLGKDRVSYWFQVFVANLTLHLEVILSTHGLGSGSGQDMLSDGIVARCWDVDLVAAVVSNYLTVALLRI